MNKSILHILTFIIFTLFLASCANSHGAGMTSKVVKHADTFRNKIDKYEASRSQTYYDIDKTAQRTIKSLNSKTPDFGNISKYWELEWKVVHSHYEQLEKNFTKVGMASQKYFEILDGNKYIHKCIPYNKALDRLTAMEGQGNHKGFFEIAFLPFIGTQRILNYIHNGKDKIQFDLCT